MKFPLILLACLFLCTTTLNAQIHVGPALGLHGTAYASSDYGLGLYLSGRAGAQVSLPLAHKCRLQPAAFWAPKEYLMKYNRPDKLYSFRVNSIEVPVTFLYYMPEGKRAAFFLGAGPVLSLNLKGIARVNQSYANQQSSELEYDLSFGANGGLRRFSAGMGVNAGWEWHKGLQLHLFYQRALTTIYTYTGNAAIGSSCAGVSLAYMFGKHRKQTKSTDKEPR